MSKALAPSWSRPTPRACHRRQGNTSACGRRSPHRHLTARACRTILPGPSGRGHPVCVGQSFGSATPHLRGRVRGPRLRAPPTTPSSGWLKPETSGRRRHDVPATVCGLAVHLERRNSSWPGASAWDRRDARGATAPTANYLSAEVASGPLQVIQSSVSGRLPRLSASGTSRRADGALMPPTMADARDNGKAPRPPGGNVSLGSGPRGGRLPTARQSPPAAGPGRCRAGSRARPRLQGATCPGRRARADTARGHGRTEVMRVLPRGGALRRLGRDVRRGGATRPSRPGADHWLAANLARARQPRGGMIPATAHLSGGLVVPNTPARSSSRGATSCRRHRGYGRRVAGEAMAAAIRAVRQPGRGHDTRHAHHLGGSAPTVSWPSPRPVSALRQVTTSQALSPRPRQRRPLSTNPSVSPCAALSAPTCWTWRPARLPVQGARRPQYRPAVPEGCSRPGRRPRRPRRHVPDRHGPAGLRAANVYGLALLAALLSGCLSGSEHHQPATPRPLVARHHLVTFLVDPAAVRR